MIEVKNIEVVLSNHRILDNISLKIPAGEITTILGESGSGKSVLLKTINSIFSPNKGSVLINGSDIHSLSKKSRFIILKDMAILFQGAALIDSMNVFQNVALPLYEHTKFSESEIKEKVIKSLEVVNLFDILKKFPSELSGGMRKRVALARAIILEPKYIFYDEPTTGLDPKTSENIINLILRLQKDLDITSIVISHDKNCINKVSDHIVVLSDKNIHFKGDYKNFLQQNDKICATFQLKEG